MSIDKNIHLDKHGHEYVGRGNGIDFGKSIEGMFKKIHVIEDECPQLRVQCYADEAKEHAHREQQQEPPPPPAPGQLALFGEAA